MSGTLSPSEMHSLFAGLELAHGAAGLCGSAASDGNSTSSTDQFAVPLELAVEEQAGLQAWQSAFLEHWKQTWPEPIGRRWSITNFSCKATRLRSFIAKNAGQHRFQVAVADTEFTHWLIIDDCLVTGHLDALLGAGDIDSLPSERRNWGPVEHQLTGRLINGISNSLFPSLSETNRSAWKISAVDSADDLLARVPVFLSCELVEFDIEVSCPASVGHLRLAIPRALLSRCPSLGSSLTTPSVRPAIGSNGESVSLRATLNPVTLSRTEIDQLQVGDVLLIGADAQANCQVSLSGQLRFQATIGSHQGHKAIRLVADIE